MPEARTLAIQTLDNLGVQKEKSHEYENLMQIIDRWYDKEYVDIKVLEEGLKYEAQAERNHCQTCEPVKISKKVTPIKSRKVNRNYS